MKNNSPVYGRKTRKIAGVSAVFVLLLAASALAYFILYANGSGTGSGTLGKATAPTTEVTLTASFPAGLVPGGEKELTLSAKNTGSTPGQIRKMTITPSVTAPGCEGSWFSVVAAPGNTNAEKLLGSGLTTPISLEANMTSFTVLNIPGVELKMIDTGASQSACENATVTLTLHSTP